MHGLTFNIQPLESVLIHTHTMELELPLRASQMSLIPQPKHANRSSLRVAMKIDVKSFNAATVSNSRETHSSATDFWTVLLAPAWKGNAQYNHNMDKTGSKIAKGSH